MQSQEYSRNKLWIAAFTLVALLGLTLRIVHTAGFSGIGFDENLYRLYLNLLQVLGVSQYPELISAYIDQQSTLSYSILPPTRANFIVVAYLWMKAFGGQPLAALKHVATLFTCLSFLLSGVFALRLGDRTRALAVFAMMAVAPTQLHMSQHALVDGVFAFWALLNLWLLWENLQSPNNSRWLVALAIGLAAMVTTKENAFFAYLGMLTILAANRWLGFGKVTPELCLIMVLGPFFGVVTLILLAGGATELLHTYTLSVSKNFTLPFAIKTGDGPWYRYLVDLMVVSPVILICAFGEIFRLKRESKPQLYLLLFVTGSYLIMCNLKYGMNLRYANMWDFPLRVLAYGGIASFCDRFPKRREFLLLISCLVVCAVELRQYYIFTVLGNLYELVTSGLLHAVKILK